MAERDGKPWYKSKMIGFNVLLVAGLEIASTLGEGGLLSSEQVALVMAVGNILLRLVTKEPVRLKSE